MEKGSDRSSAVIMPGVTRAAVLRDPIAPGGTAQLGAIQAVAPFLGIAVRASHSAHLDAPPTQDALNRVRFIDMAQPDSETRRRCRGERRTEALGQIFKKVSRSKKHVQLLFASVQLA
jgi:hypothetical protein